MRVCDISSAQVRTFDPSGVLRTNYIVCNKSVTSLVFKELNFHCNETVFQSNVLITVDAMLYWQFFIVFFGLFLHREQIFSLTKEKVKLIMDHHDKMERKWREEEEF